MNSAIIPRLIIAWLTEHNKVEILMKRRSLRDRKSRYTVKEDLTETRWSIFKTLRDEYEDNKSKVWTIDSIIFFRTVNNPAIIERCTSLKEVRQALNKS